MQHKMAATEVPLHSKAQSGMSDKHL